MAITCKSDPWRQRVMVRAGDQSGLIQVTSGKVVIYYVDSSGTRKYYNSGTQAYQTDYVENTCVINASDRSVSLPWTPTLEVEDRDVIFEGWINGDKSTLHVETVRVDPPEDLSGATIIT